MSAHRESQPNEHGDAQVLRFPNRRQFVRRFPPLVGVLFVIGFALGGEVGIGTVLITFSLGPLTHAGLRRFHLPVHEDAPEVMGE